MINVQPRRTEVEYRAIPTDSSSTIKEFYVDPKKYFKKYVMGEHVEDEDSKSTIIGSLVHLLLLEPDNFDDKYYVSSLEDKPTEKMLEFCNHLYDETMSSINEDGVQTREFSFIAMDAYKKSGYKLKFETIMEKFSGMPEDYYSEMLITKPKGLSIISLNDMKIAEDIVETIKGDEFIGDIIRQESTDNIDVYTELQLEGPNYKVYDLPMKGMIDKLIVDHNMSEIWPWDFKVTWEPQNFLEGYYFYRRAYIQALIYYKLLEVWASEEGFDGYLLHFPSFIVADSGNFYKPLVYTLDATRIGEANNGFSHRGKDYKGVQEIITDLKWARDKNEWKISRTDYVNKGIVKL